MLFRGKTLVHGISVTTLLFQLAISQTFMTLAQQEFETYESKEFGFTIEHPLDWKPTEPSSFETEVVGHRPYIIRMELPSSLEDDVATRTNRPMVEIGMDISDSNSLEQYVSERIDRTVSTTPDMNINTNKTTLAGLPAIAVVMTSPGGGGKGMDIYTMTNEGTIYNIDYTAHDSKFDTYLRPIVQKMIDSFKINTSESQSNATQGQELEVSLQNNSAPDQDSIVEPGISTGEIVEGPSLSGHESKILISIQLKPHENEFLADTGYYQVSSFQMTVNNSQDLCPTGNCEYNIEKGEFRTDPLTGGYVLEGTLKATVTEGDTKSSKFFLINADLDKVRSEETPTKLTEFLEGTIGFGGTTFDPDFEYEVVNGTFAEGKLQLPGMSETFG